MPVGSARPLSRSERRARRNQPLTTRPIGGLLDANALVLLLKHVALLWRATADERHAGRTIGQTPHALGAGAPMQPQTPIRQFFRTLNDLLRLHPPVIRTPLALNPSCPGVGFRFVSGRELGKERNCE